ncbi:hypothetical protein C900_03705 [Fulvivirga imtechensis AK7]|uniref:Phosphatidylcholine 1-acylhydrolase n=1 Tax=Fulvivirga imtechensis AK7 TaxID=1237149 RepID=L8JNC7_9BACT|nr:hypothetical protein [Fulvivirga imtechensis]ELR70451.1 hypothetical protein C900_03705 [Fulvivirga imtechensis AK7]
MLIKQHLVFIFILISAFGQAQYDDQSTASDSSQFLSLIYANRDLTYFTFFDGVGNLPNMVTEARFSGSYFLKNSKVNWALELNLNMTLRILDKKSYPIPPPSYNPELTYYRLIRSSNSGVLSKLLFKNAYWEISLGHHSNGRAGDFYKADSLGNETRQIDLRDASFTTHYIELGYSTFHHRKNNAGQDFYTNLKLALRVLPALMATEELNDSYGFYRAFITYNIFRIPLGNLQNSSGFFSRSRLRFHAGWIFGDVFNAAANEAEKRLVGEVTWFYFPDWLAEMGFFVQYYYGQDYYNLQFMRTMNTFRIGISSNPLNFSGFRKFLKN